MSDQAGPKLPTIQEELEFLGRRIAEKRILAGLSQAKLAEQVGLNHVTISRVENAKQAVSVASLIEIARALRTTPSELLEDN